MLAITPPMGPLGVNTLRAIRFSLNPMTSFLKRGKLSSPSLGDPKLNQFSQQFDCKKFYGFFSDPFDPQPDPRLIFLTENVKEFGIRFCLASPKIRDSFC
jgi:hypothetical protein